jgi:hypothetical protein
MKRFAKILGVTCVAALTLAAMTAAGASAATFTASATGGLTGTQTSNQVFTFGSGGVTCKKAHMTGTIVSIATTSQHVTVNYSECSSNFFGFSATVSAGTYLLTASGEIHILNTITFSVPSLGCSTTVSPQSLKSVSYTNTAGGKVEMHGAVAGIKSTATGGLCSSGTAGTFTGSNILERINGGTFSWHA